MAAVAAEAATRDPEPARADLDASARAAGLITLELRRQHAVPVRETHFCAGDLRWGRATPAIRDSAAVRSGPGGGHRVDLLDGTWAAARAGVSGGILRGQRDVARQRVT